MRNAMKGCASVSLGLLTGGPVICAVFGAKDPAKRTA
jgi:hypothetical protein